MKTWSLWSNKMGILPRRRCVNNTVWIHYMDSNETPRENAGWELHKNASCYFELILEATPQKFVAVWLLTSYLRNQQSKTNRTIKKVRTSSWATFSHRLLLINDQQRFTCFSSVWTLDADLMTNKEHWMRGTNYERESGKSMRSVWFDDDDDDGIF